MRGIGPSRPPARARSAAALAATLTCLCGPPALAADGASGQDDHGDSGDLLLSVREAGVLPPRQFEASFLLDNYDRDPLGIDVVDGSVALRLGVAKRLEVYLGYQITRSVSTPGAHPVPSPPLDIVVLGGEAPAPPYRSLYWPMPYLSHHTSRVDEMVPGEYTLGARVDLLSRRGLRPGVTLAAQLTGPGTTARYDLSKGSGSGVVDYGLHSAASWRLGRLRAAVNVGLSLNGDVDPGDRVVVVGSAGAVRDGAIRRPSFLHGGLGLRVRIVRGLSAVAELAGWSPVGGRTPVQAESGASELLGGVLLEVKNATLALGVRWHLRPEPHGLTRATGPLAGAVDLSALAQGEREQFLRSLGAEAQRHDANLVVVGLPAGLPLPEGARTVAPSYETSTMGNLGAALRVSFRLGR